jgi:hypothetical protein
MGNKITRTGARRAWIFVPLALTGLLFWCQDTLGGGILEKTTDEVFELSATGTLSIRNTDGRICIYGSDIPQLQVKAVRRAFTAERLEKIKVDVAIHGDSAVIETTYPPSPNGSLLADRSGTVDYTIIVPQKCALAKVELSNGEIVIDGMYGPLIDARLGNGRMQIQNCFSRARLILGHGAFDLFYDWWEALPFAVSAEINNGDLHLFLPPEAALHLDGASVNGQITNHFPTLEVGDGVSATDTRVGEGSAEFKLRTTNGNLKIEKAY